MIFVLKNVITYLKIAAIMKTGKNKMPFSTPIYWC